MEDKEHSNSSGSDDTADDPVYKIDLREPHDEAEDEDEFDN